MKVSPIIFFATFIAISKSESPLPLENRGLLSHPCDGGYCVPHYTCKNESVSVNGVGVIDIRFKENEKCEHYLEICCAEADFKRPTMPASVQRVTEKPESGTEVPTSQVCGFRNVNGVGFEITGDNGSEAKFGEFPWMVAVLKKEVMGNYNVSMYQCGGSLIFPYVVLTGAHCVQGKNVDDLIIRAGEWDAMTENEMYPFTEREVAEVVIHKNFTRGNLHNDVALIFLKNPIGAELHISPICFLKNPAIDFKKCFATGWGKDKFGEKGLYQAILKKIELPIVSSDTCQKKLRETKLGKHFELHKSFICAGGKEGVDACTGDGGSPLVCQLKENPGHYQQIGIVAWGIGCGSEGIPGVYVNVPFFESWIREQVILRGLYTEHHDVPVINQ